MLKYHVTNGNTRVRIMLKHHVINGDARIMLKHHEKKMETLGLT